MIFVTVGSQKFQFNRLLKAVDDLIENGLSEEVFAQTGYSDYKPLHYKYKDFLDRDEFDSVIEKADIVITHGGTGVIIGAVKKEKKVIAVPRLAKYREHVDDHQIQLVEQFQELNLINECLDLTEIRNAVEEVKQINFESYKSNTNRIIDSIERYIEIESEL